MTDIQILLAKAQEQGATFIPGEGDELKVRAPAPLPDGLVMELRAHKKEIRALIEEQGSQLLDEEDGPILAVKIHSSILKDDLWLVFDPGFKPEDQQPVYFPDEIPLLRNKTPDELREIHKVKAEFAGTRVRCNESEQT